MSEQLNQEINVLSNRLAKPQNQPTLGLDIDGCIDEAPVFFSMLSQLWPGDVVIVTCRRDRKEARKFLHLQNIRYTDLVMVKSLSDKAKAINDSGMLVYFDDQPEALKGISSSVNVVLFRNEGNYDFIEQKWMFSKDTGRMV